MTYLASSVPRNKAWTTSWNATASGILSTAPALPPEGRLTVSGDGPADLDPGRLNDVGEVDMPATNWYKRQLAMRYIHRILFCFVTRSKVEAKNGLGSWHASWKCVGTGSRWRLKCKRTGCGQAGSGLLYNTRLIHASLLQRPCFHFQGINLGSSIIDQSQDVILKLIRKVVFLLFLFDSDRFVYLHSFTRRRPWDGDTAECRRTAAGIRGWQSTLFRRQGWNDFTHFIK